MNPYTGELIRMNDVIPEEMKQAFLNQGFEPVPDELKMMAEQELGDKESVILPQDHPLTVAMKKVAEKAKKRKKKIAKQSKRKNRR